MASECTTSRLLALPDSCLLAVMQGRGNDTRSVLSAAAAHSRLQRAAAEALSSISTPWMYRYNQAQSNSLVLYLTKHGQHVCSLAWRASSALITDLRELPPSLTKLDSLQLERMTLQLQPGFGGAQGVLRAGFPLTRLELSGCNLLDGGQGLAAALVQLPDLQHLSATGPTDTDTDQGLVVPMDVFSHLVQLTCLLLQGIRCCIGNSNGSGSSSDPSAAVLPLQALTRLVDLQLGQRCHVTADTLSGADQLTRLDVSRQRFEQRALVGKSQLQHLTLGGCSFVPGADVAQLLSELQHLTQLTHLDLSYSCGWLSGPKPPPTAYATLTASSKLQHMDVHCNTLPSAAWQYMCPPGRTLLQLRYLDISYVQEADASWSVPDTSALVSCCPGLQSLTTSMPCSTAQLAPLQRLTSLHTLVMGAGLADDLEGVQVLRQLTGLQELDLSLSGAAEARILQLTQLTRLTALMFPQGGVYKDLRCHPQDPASEPVWRQLLRQFVDSHDPAVAQQAAAGLEATR